MQCEIYIILKGILESHLPFGTLRTRPIGALLGLVCHGAAVLARTLSKFGSILNLQNKVSTILGTPFLECNRL